MGSKSMSLTPLIFIGTGLKQFKMWVSVGIYCDLVVMLGLLAAYLLKFMPEQIDFRDFLLGFKISSTERGRNMSSLRSKNNWAICLMLPASVMAQERQGLLVNASLSVISDSNITRTAEKTSDKAAVFSSQLQFLSSIGQHNFVFGYQGDFAAYDDNTQYNYNDHQLNLSAIFDHSYRINSEFTLGYQAETEEPGSNNAQTEISSEFNEQTDKSAAAKFYYGTPASTGQFVFGLDHAQQRYSNNQQSFRDLDRNTLTGTFFYRMAPKTRLLLEASVAKIDAVAGTLFADQSSDENRYLAGVEWEATAITSGTFKVGYQKKDFEDERFIDLDGLSYFLDMTWKPNTYTNITIGAERSTSESAEQDIGGFITTGYSLALGHALSARTQLKANYSLNESDFSDAQDRTDKRKSITVGMSHSLRTWLDISLDYRHLTRSSNDEIFDFSSDTVELSLTSKFD
jgi:hypothetical protein